MPAQGCHPPGVTGSPRLPFKNHNVENHCLSRSPCPKLTDLIDVLPEPTSPVCKTFNWFYPLAKPCNIREARKIPEELTNTGFPVSPFGTSFGFIFALKGGSERIMFSPHMNSARSPLTVGSIIYIYIYMFIFIDITPISVHPRAP